jgi:hypothetical protein
VFWAGTGRGKEIVLFSEMLKVAIIPTHPPIYLAPSGFFFGDKAART